MVGHLVVVLLTAGETVGNPALFSFSQKSKLIVQEGKKFVNEMAKIAFLAGI